MLFMVCGFRQTGKDTLCKMFNKELAYNWLNYGKAIDIVPCIRISFADKLRDEVNNEYSNVLENFSGMDYEELKRTVVYEGQTYRDILISHAKYRRDQDINYWVGEVVDEIRELLNKDKNIMITDWRYPNELEYLQQAGFNPITVRLFRSDVPIPSDDIVSEHALDFIMTDSLLVTNTDDYYKALKLFPQYQ